MRAARDMFSRTFILNQEQIMNAYQNYAIWTGRTIPFRTENDAALTEHFLTEPVDGIDRLTDVSEAEITHYPASGRGPHPAVVVCPGGGYGILAWNHEGQDICAFLNTVGFSAFLLKYRVPDRRAGAHADAARALRFIRANAEKFNIDPGKLGIMGFSAGGHLAASVSAPANAVPYPPEDAIDGLAFRPDFTLLIYPAYLVKDIQALSLNDEFSINESTPPAFIIQAEDDGIQVENALAWYAALKRSGVPVEMHLYATGGHGYGLLRTGSEIANWPLLASVWLRNLAGLK